MKLAIVGVGKLGLSLLEGILKRGVLPPEEIGLMDANLSRAAQLCEKHGTLHLKQNTLAGSTRVLVSVQPRVFPEISEWLAQPNTGYISTMAGVSTASLTRRLGTKRVVRVMPNLAAPSAKPRLPSRPPERRRTPETWISRAACSGRWVRSTSCRSTCSMPLPA